ncbi:hypothetical protein PLICRDRAFT_155122 [Plicaturopsis crispa FD-325 SS-3]|nr:hypothetical protein PLICRDRAFT_155122 [Plicaturopsis crispa FD-325 SS-3]
MGSKYLFYFAQAHAHFRVPELESIAELNGFTIGFPDGVENIERDISTPCMVLSLDKEEHARILARRCILIRSVYEFYAQGATYDELHAANRASRPLWSKYIPDTSFKFTVYVYNHTVSQSYQRRTIESFSYMDFRGKIDLKDPDISLACFEEYTDSRGLPQEKRAEHRELLQIYLGRLIEDGSARSLIAQYDVKKRTYFGNTSMESEISLLMANQGLASPGKLIYDPFVGTGSMVYTAAHFGAMVFGSDIDGRQMRGKEKLPGIIRAAAQYGTAQRVIDLCTFDVTHNPWRCGELFDALVTDPPYGVRAGAKRLGRRRVRKAGPLPDYHSPDQPYIPPTKPYELSHLATDLVLLARYLLKPGGRLVFFLPTVTEEYTEVDVRAMLCEGMDIVANSLQDFGAWGRRVSDFSASRQCGTDGIR